jgi:serine/threonine protein kinase
MPVVAKDFRVWVALVPLPIIAQPVAEEQRGDDTVTELPGLDWCGYGDSHVDFERHEALPLSEEKFLGHGANGEVYSTQCQSGELVAWKKIYCPRGIRLVGSYTRKPYLGLLLWPVAVTDLASFLDGVDGFTTHQESTLGTDVMDEAKASIKEVVGMQEPATLLRQSIGCLASAVAYLHANSIRHKDLKPANILLYSNGLRLTDFGTATDFSDFSQSATEGGDRGTPKYFSPETSALEPCGRASDMFTLGCVFLEMLAVANGYSLQDLKQSRPDKDRSFQANLDSIQTSIETMNFTTCDNFLLSDIKLMLARAPRSRPTIQDVQHRLQYIELFSDPQIGAVYHGQCCTITRSPLFHDPQDATEVNLEFELEYFTDSPSLLVSVIPKDCKHVERLVVLQVCTNKLHDCEYSSYSYVAGSWSSTRRRFSIVQIE